MFKEIINEKFNNENTKELSLFDGEVTINVKRVISLYDATLFTDGVADACVTEDGNYNPAFKEYMTKLSTLAYFTDIEAESFDDVTDEDYLAYTEFFATEDFEKIIDCIDSDFYNQLLDAVDEKIDFKIECYTCSLTSGTHEALNNIQNFLKELEDSLPQIYESLNNEDIQKIVKSMTDIGNIGETDVIDRVIKPIYESEEKDEDK